MVNCVDQEVWAAPGGHADSAGMARLPEAHATQQPLVDAEKFSAATRQPIVPLPAVLLPRQSERELALAETRSQLDTALGFLSTHVGHAMLDDARLTPGGSVVLSDATCTRQPPPRLDRHPEHHSESSKSHSRSNCLKLPENIARHAVYEDDVELVERFLVLLDVTSGTAMHKRKRETKHEISEKLAPVLLRAIKLLHLCDYDYADIVLVMVHTSVYFRSVWKEVGSTMDATEAAYVCVLLMFMAHSFILDETCPLKCWQQHLFRQYCSLPVLNAALFHLFRMHNFCLRISQEELIDALWVLTKGNKHRTPSKDTIAEDWKEKIDGFSNSRNLPEAENSQELLKFEGRDTSEVEDSYKLKEVIVSVDPAA